MFILSVYSLYLSLLSPYCHRTICRCSAPTMIGYCGIFSNSPWQTLATLFPPLGYTRVMC